ncbi:prepilin-type N-terminal cleavage/methylation domain-containing protein [Shewanella sp. VB17]|uniref:type IV pilus modification PilV family protein n=1 Tax=Shewanella sp. VB17 TaxID=2739432 RepID=UPI001565DB11|nr:prepilin-type N-terminal cleavage/methylation domain-containing protein [Shewanella sp. VB17]NRD72903.1 prepilin-type N-terminal cleavage/methylation domain-containing protein [Shewanella sp. VB17]
MKKQNGIALLEVLIAVSIVGVIMLYVSQLQSSQLVHKSQTLAAAKVAKIYQLTTEVMFDPLVRRKNSDINDIETWETNDTIEGLKNSISTGVEYIYLDAQTPGNQKVANFFNGAYFNTNRDSCAVSNGVENERVGCTAGLEDEFILGHSYRVKGIKVDGVEQSYFSINHLDNSNISDVKPTVITIFIDGLHGQKGLKDIYDLAEAVSEQVSQIDDMNSSAYADIHIADFSGAVTSYDTGINTHEALLGDTSITITGDMGLAIVFDLSGTQALRSDGMIAMQASRSLCWNVSTGSSGDDLICQSAIASDVTSDNGADGNNDPSRFIKTEGNLLYQTADQESTDKVYRTPVEVVVEAFQSGNAPIDIAKPVCPTIQGDELLPYLSVVGSSFSNSGVGDFPEVDDTNYGDNSVSDVNNEAEMVSGILFRWEDKTSYWEVTGNVGSANDATGYEGTNPESLQIVALRWCEAEKT